MSVYDEIQDAAYSYLALDLPTIPICSHNHRSCSDKHKERCTTPGKAPTLSDWTNHMSTTDDDLDEWFKFNKYMNIGMVLGQTSIYNLVGIDIDGALGEATFQKVSESQEVPFTWEFTSGNGRRLIYNMPDGVQTKKHRVVWQVGHEELAFLAKGQQTIIPPSMHSNGTQYAWVEGHSPFDCDVAEAPKWILDKVRLEDAPILTRDQPEDLPPGMNGTPLNISTPVVAEENMVTVGEGGRNNQLTRLVGSLCAKRVLSKETVLQTALQQNRLYNNPPLAEGEVISMVETIYHSEMAKHQKMIQKQRRKEELTPVVLAEKFMVQLNNNGIFWKYNQKQGKMYRTQNGLAPWKILSQENANAEIHTFLAEQEESLATSGMCNEMFNQLVIWSTKKYGEGEELNLGEHPYSQYIAINNGVLDWEKKELLPWTSEYNHTTKIEADWLDVNTDSEVYQLWNTALHTWLDSEETIAFLQEYIGYALLPSCKMRTAVFLYGEGANGKSLFIDAITTLFASSMQITQPAALCERFGTVNVVDKLLIVCSDVDATYLDKTGALKLLIAGDPIRAEYKGGKEFHIVPVAKMLFSANKLPKAADRSHGWYSRLQLVEFTHRFKEDSQYYTKFIQSMTSAEGKAVLLHWAVEGLIRLQQNGEWTTSESMQESKQQYREENDNTLAFLNEYLQPSGVKSGGYKTSLQIQSLYSMYAEWCQDQGVKPVGQPNFIDTIKHSYDVRQLKWKVKGAWKSIKSVIDAELKCEEYRASYAFTSNVKQM